MTELEGELCFLQPKCVPTLLKSCVQFLPLPGHISQLAEGLSQQTPNGEWKLLLSPPDGCCMETPDVLSPFEHLCVQFLIRCLPVLMLSSEWLGQVLVQVEAELLVVGELRDCGQAVCRLLCLKSYCRSSKSLLGSDPKR